MFKAFLLWVHNLWDHQAAPAVTNFVTQIVQDEVPVAEKYVATVIASLPADIVASKPLVAVSHVASEAAKAAESDSIVIGTHALLVASTNAVQVLQSAAGQTGHD